MIDLKKKQIFFIVWFILSFGLVLLTDSYVVAVTSLAVIFGSFIVFGVLEMKEKKEWNLIIPTALSIPFFIVGLFPLIDFISGPEKEVVFISQDSIKEVSREEHDVVPDYESFLEFNGGVYFKDNAAKKVDLHELVDSEVTVTYYKLTNRIINIESK